MGENTVGWFVSSKAAGQDSAKIKLEMSSQKNLCSNWLLFDMFYIFLWKNNQEGYKEHFWNQQNNIESTQSLHYQSHYMKIRPRLHAEHFHDHKYLTELWFLTKVAVPLKITKM